MPAVLDMNPNSGQSVTCCPAFYEQSWVRKIAGGSFHPGGEALSRATVKAMNLPPQARLLDVGSGVGATALMLTREFQLRLSGVDLSAANAALARERAGKEGADAQFISGDALALPFADDTFDGVLSECVLSLCQDQPVALAEVRRVLKPRAVLAITDMALNGPLAGDLAGVIAPWACLLNAHTRRGYEELFESAGFTVLHTENESAGLTSLLSRLKRRLLILGAGGMLAETGMPVVDLEVIRHWLERFGQEVERGSIQYLRFHLSA